jgi:hypothetical protein
MTFLQDCELESDFLAAIDVERWSQDFGPFVEVDRLIRKTI